MAIDAMDIDSAPGSASFAETEKERKRKHKHKDEASSPSKKKRKHDKTDDADKKSKKKKDKSSKSKDKSRSYSTHQTTAIPDSPYSLTTATLYLPLSPISISPTHALASLLAEHLSPLLLTYYPPLQGIILAYSNSSISSEPPTSAVSSPADPNPQPLTLATTAGEYGVMYVYLTTTFLVFRPQRGQTLEGWVNVQSDGFLGAVVLNLFSVGIERKRLPPSWKWIPPGEEDEAPTTNPHTPTSDEDEDSEPKDAFDPAKEHFNPIPLPQDSTPFFPSDTTENLENITDPTAMANNDFNDDSEENVEGHFQSVSGHRVRGTIKFRVVDIDIIPGSERDRGFISIEGTMLSPEDEERVLEDERNGIMAPGSVRKPNASMSGGIVVPVPISEPEEVNVVDVELDVDTPSKKPRKEKKEKKSKTKA
ncbi:hypothetical protein BJY04DRAFT_113418 [Aspergillus karnatakaensis]|uniref:DNA-directed RNA polymerase I subunit RPA43 n=1 Tax=Aspergillus karnatakaensis TaxID=1810916 RepID=UPI003CCDD1DB